jgi:hypothetical protein
VKSIIGGHGGEFAIQPSVSRRRDPLLNLLSQFGARVGKNVERALDAVADLRTRQSILRRLYTNFLPFGQPLGFVRWSALADALHRYTHPAGPFEEWSHELSCRMAWRKSMRTGLVRHSPYLTKHVFELGLNVPATLGEGSTGTNYRPVIGRLSAGLIPEKTRSQSKHGLFCPFVRAKMEMREQRLLDIAWDAVERSSTIRSVVDYRAFSDFLGQYLSASRRQHIAGKRHLPGSLILWLPLAAMAWSRGQG